MCSISGKSLVPPQVRCDELDVATDAGNGEQRQVTAPVKSWLTDVLELQMRAVVSLENQFLSSNIKLRRKKFSRNPPYVLPKCSWQVFFFRWVTFWVWIKLYLLQFTVDFVTFLKIITRMCSYYCAKFQHCQNSYMFTYILAISYDNGSL